MKQKELSTYNLFKVYYGSFRNRCFVCGIKSYQLLCHYCQNGIDKNLTYCQRCKLPTEMPLDTCGQCQVIQPEYHQLIAPYLYKGLIKAMILQLKFNQKTANIHVLCNLLIRELHSHYSHTSTTSISTWPTALFYVPSHIQRVRERGFCHMKMLAKALRTELPRHIKLEHRQLTKTIHNKAQHNQDRKQRLKLPRNTFSAIGPIPEHIALLDDVITTGTTINACITALQKAGAKKIDVWSLARTPPPETEQDDVTNGMN